MTPLAAHYVCPLGGVNCEIASADAFATGQASKPYLQGVLEILEIKLFGSP